MPHPSIRLSSALLGLLLWSCKPDRPAETPQQTSPETAASSSVPTAAAAPCPERVKAFLRWYARYYERGDTSTYFINSPLTGEEDSATLAKMPRDNISSTKYMQLNRRKLAVYLDTLRRSGYFSASYLAATRASILERGRDLEARKIEEGVPHGFDYDEVLNTQDIYDLKDIDKLKVYRPANLSPGTQAYSLTLPPDFTWYFYFKQENGRCVLDSVRAN